MDIESVAVPGVPRTIQDAMEVSPRSRFDERPAVFFWILDRFTNVFVRMFCHRCRFESRPVA